jgi:localization factor PodJL
MKLGAPWQVSGVGREARQTAREAARRAGMSIGEWLDSIILESAEADNVESGRPGEREYSPFDQDFAGRADEARPSRGRHAEYDYRLALRAADRGDPSFEPEFSDRTAPAHDHDAVEREYLRHGRMHEARAQPSGREAPSKAASQAHIASELEQRLPLDGNEDPSASQPAFAELNRRLDELTRGLGKVAAASGTQAAHPDPRNADASHQLFEVISKLDRRLDQLIASMRPATASEGLPRARAQELSGLEQQLHQINAHVETLKPCGVEKAIDVLRDDLAQIGVMLQDALPRKSVEAIEHEMRMLADRIESSRDAGADEAALASVERGLAEVRDALRGLAPAANLQAVDRELQQLSQKIDFLAHNSQDQAALQQLESAITGVRGIVSNITSNDALASLANEVQTLASKMDRVAAASGSDNVLNALEERIATLADALAARNQVGQNVPHQLEAVIKGLVDKIERVQLTRSDHAALGHFEDRIAKLVEKLDASDARLSHLEAIERGLAELLIHLEQQRMANSGRPELLRPELGELSRHVADLRQTGKKTQEWLEVVHGTLGQLVDRLAMIETDIQSKPVRRMEGPSGENAAVASTGAPMSKPTAPPQPAMGAAIPGTAAVNKAAGKPVNTVAGLEPPKVGVTNGQPPSTPLAQVPQPVEFVLTESLRPDGASDTERRTIDASLSPDRPLEPGSSRFRRRPRGSPADRIAASEAALIGATAPVGSDSGGKSNFIAAARRAAQAASRGSPVKAAAMGPRKIASATDRLASGTGKTRARIAAGAAIVIVIGGLQITKNFLSSPPEAQGPAPQEQRLSGAVTPGHPADIAHPNGANPNPSGAKEATPPAREPASPPPASSELSSARPSAVFPSDGVAFPLPPGVAIPREIARQATSAPQPAGEDDVSDEREVTGSTTPVAGPESGAPTTAPAPAAHARAVPPPPPAPAQPIPAQPAPAQISALSPAGTDKLPAALSSSLRAAAGRGDAPAQYEIAVRFAEGDGVAQNFTEAAQWFERAAKQGLVPAQFRLGGLYEKGLGVKKNLDTARRYYVAAGEAGNAKALHNLAVLYAEGIDGKPDYATAAKWFRKAADYGIADSQYNLAVLYARGIGVEQNLAEAYKWFALAAQDGDTDSARKRDELEARLGRTSLSAAVQAVQDWSRQQQPEAAVDVKTPPGGWDQAVSSISVPVKHKPPVVITPKLDLATPRHDQ